MTRIRLALMYFFMVAHKAGCQTLSKALKSVKTWRYFSQRILRLKISKLKPEYMAHINCMKFNIWTTYFVDVDTFIFQLHQQTNKWWLLCWSNRKCFQNTCSQLRFELKEQLPLLVNGNTMGVNLYDIEMLQLYKECMRCMCWMIYKLFNCDGNIKDIAICCFWYSYCRKSAIKTVQFLCMPFTFI